MSFQTPDLWNRAGVLADDTPLAAKGYATSSDKIRWHLGRAQSQPGWSYRIGGIQGICRGLTTWADNEGSPYVGIGTHTKLYAHLGSDLFDITPLRASGAIPNNAFETTNGSTTVAVSWTAHGFTTGDTAWITGVAVFNGVTIGGASGAFAADPFIVSSGSSVVIATLTAHGLNDNDIITIAGSAAINGITPNGTFRVQVLTVDTFTIVAATEATSSGTGGGAGVTYQAYKPYLVDVQTADLFNITASSAANATGAGGGAAGLYQADLGVGSAVGGLSAAGYGTGPFGMGPYGSSTILSSAPILPRTWSLGSWGEYLVANPFGGSIYEWQLDPSARAARITNSPLNCNVMLVTAERSMLACGCTNLVGVFDPLLVRNSDIENNTIWTPGVDNNAGDFRLSLGSGCVGALNTQGGSLIWTDSALYAVTFQGLFDQIFSFDLISASTGLIGPNAAVDLNGDVFWMSTGHEVYRFSGGKPIALEFPLKRWLIDRVSQYCNHMIYAFIDLAYPAVTWLFPTPPDDDCDEYVRLDVKEMARDPYGGWSFGTWDRTAWTPASIFRLPMAVSTGGILWEHETGTGAITSAPGVEPVVTEAIERHVEFAAVQLGSGDRVANVNAFLPDINMTAATALDAILSYRRFPMKAAEVKAAITVASDSGRLSARGQGRQVQLRLESDGTEDDWRLGTLRLDLTEGSRR